MTESSQKTIPGEKWFLLAQAGIVCFWLLSFWSFFWKDTTSFRTMVWGFFAFMVVVHIGECLWWTLRQKRRGEAVLGRVLVGIFLFGGFFLWPHLQKQASV